MFKFINKFLIMKNNILLFVFTLIVFNSCKSLNYIKEDNLTEIKMPFKEKKFPDTEVEFHSIQNAKGDNMNINRNRALMAAKTDLSGKIKTVISTIARQELKFNNSQETEIFDQKAASISQQSISKLIKVDSKTYREKEGDIYDYWVVYKVYLEDVSQLINSSNLGFIVNSEKIFQNIQQTNDVEN